MNMDMAGAARIFTERGARRSPASARQPRSSARDVNVFYGEKHALKEVNVDIPDRA